MGMDMRTGEIYDPDQFGRIKKMFGGTVPAHMREIPPPTQEQLDTPMGSRMKVARNDCCPCGSGYKFKNCCQRAGLAKTA